MAAKQGVEITIFDQIKPKVSPVLEQQPSIGAQILIPSVEINRTNGTNTEQTSLRHNTVLVGQATRQEDSQYLSINNNSQAQSANISPFQSRKLSANSSGNADSQKNLQTISKPYLRKQSTLLERRSQLSGLKPIVTSKLQTGYQSVGQSPLTRISNTSNKEIDKINKEIQDKNQKASDAGLSPGMRSKLLNEAASLKRKATVQRFQRAVKLALEHKRRIEDQNKIFYNEPGTATVKDTNFFFKSRADLMAKSPGVEPMTPGLVRQKMSFFDVVRSLNPFSKNRKNAIQLDEPTQINTQRTDQELLEKQKQLNEKKKERARHLWRKAKAVLRAINVWKQVQGDIQLYGTHNYEFRQTFKVAQTSSQFRKQNSQRNFGSGGAIKRQSTSEPIPVDNRMYLMTHGKKAATPKKCKTYIHPEGNFKRIWSFVILFFMIYVGSLMPYKMAFFDQDETLNFLIFDIICDFIFLCDVAVNCVSAYYNSDGILITGNKEIFLNYLSGWFFIDVAASAPMNMVDQFKQTQESESSKYASIIRLFRLPRLYRLVQVTKINKVLNNLKKNSLFLRFDEFLQRNQGVIKLLQLCLNGIICIHVSGCFWYLIAKLEDFGPTTWVMNLSRLDDSDGRKYLTSIYWAVSTVLTVGYGDIHAFNSVERLVSCIWMMIGVAFYSLTIGVITSVLGKIDSRQSQLKNKLEIIDDFCQESKIHHSFKRKIRDALEYHSQKNAFSFIEKYQILNELPANLKYEIAMQIHGGQIGKLSFFQKKDMTFIGNIVPLLQPFHALQGDYIYFIDDHPYDIYFILKGRVNFMMDAGSCIFKSWPKGSYFGEIEIIFQKKRICTAQAEQECDIFTLNKKFYQTVIFNDYPEIEKQLRELAIEREAKINETLAKARKVLESIGIQDALNLPTRNGKRTSIGSMNTSLKKRYQLEKISNMKKIAMSFEHAGTNKSITASELSRKAQFDKDINSSPGKNQDQESSSSGDFNIWGDDVNSAAEEEESGNDQESQDSNQQLGGKKRVGKGKRRKSSLKKKGKEQKENENFKKFNTFFHNTRSNRLGGLANQRQESNITEEDEEDDSSNLEDEIKIRANYDTDEIKEAEENQEYTEKSPTRKDENDGEQEEILSFDSSKKNLDTLKPMIKIIKEDEKINALLDNSINDHGKYSATPLNMSANMKLQISSPNLNQIKKQKQSATPTKNSIENFEQKVGVLNSLATNLPIQGSVNHSSNTSVNISKLTEKSPPPVNRSITKPIIFEKRVSEKLKAVKKAQIPKKKNSSSIDVIRQGYNSANTSSRNKSSNQVTQNLFSGDKRMTVQKQVFTIQIKEKPVKQPLVSTKQVELQALELMSMKKTLKTIMTKFKEANSEKEMVQNKVNGLQSTIDLMAKMLKDLHQKQMMKKINSDSHKSASVKTIKQKRNEPQQQELSYRKEKSEKTNQNTPRSNKQDRIENFDRNEKRELQIKYRIQEYQNFKPDKSYHPNGGKSRNSEVPLIQDSENGNYVYWQSFTLNSENSLIPVNRKVRKQETKLQSTSVEEHKRKGTTIKDYSFSDDIEILQKEYADVYHNSLPDQ